MGITTRQQMYDHTYEIEQLGLAVHSIRAGLITALVNPVFEDCERDALARLYDVALAVGEYIDPYVESEDKPALSEYLTGFPNVKPVAR